MGDVKWHPILFKGRLVRKILEGHKTQTRRVLKVPTEWQLAKKPDSYGPADFAFLDMADPVGTYPTIRTCPYGKPGDRLWVRETWAGCCGRFAYKADGTVVGGFKKSWLKDCKWSPSIHMFRSASRISLEVVDVKVQRLQDMSEADAHAEGVDMEWRGFNPEPGAWPCPACNGTGLHGAFGADYGVTEVDCRECDTALKSFHHLWDSINKKRGFGWNVNSWVWVVEFKVLERSRA